MDKLTKLKHINFSSLLRPHKEKQSSCSCTYIDGTELDGRGATLETEIQHPVWVHIRTSFSLGNGGAIWVALNSEASAPQRVTPSLASFLQKSEHQ